MRYQITGITFKYRDVIKWLNTKKRRFPQINDLQFSPVYSKEEKRRRPLDKELDNVDVTIGFGTKARSYFFTDLFYCCFISDAVECGMLGFCCLFSSITTKSKKLLLRLNRPWEVLFFVAEICLLYIVQTAFCVVWRAMLCLG